MREISENLSLETSPTKVILQVFENHQMLFENNGKLLSFDKITILANSDRIYSLSETELFTLLWYCSCRNVFAYQEGYYVAMTKNGVNVKLINTLHNYYYLRSAQ